MLKIEKIKELLDIEANIELTDLYDKLFQYRSSVHPDKHPREMEKKYNEKFIEANDYLKWLQTQITNEANNQMNVIELAPYSKQISERSLQFEVINLQMTCSELQKKYDILLEDLKKTKMEEKKINFNEFEQKRKSIEKKHEITKTDKLLYGTTLGFATLIIILRQISEVKNFIIPNFIYGEVLVDMLILLAYLGVVGKFSVDKFMNRNIKLIISGISTTQTKCEFIEYINNLNKTYHFTETDIVDFVKEHIRQYKIVNYITNFWLFNTNKLLTDVSKDTLIRFLINHSIIEVDSINNGIIRFRFKNLNRYSFDGEREGQEIPFVF